MKKQTLHDLTNNKWYKFILLLVGISLVFLIWYIISIAISNPLFPGPQVVIPVFFKKTLVLSTYEAIFYTLLRLILSFSISFVIAFIFGILGGLFKTINLILKPIVTVLRTIPTAALILILIVLLKPTNALIIIVFLIMFPILYDAIATGLINVDENIKKALRIDSGLHNPKAIFKVMLPCSFPYILLGIVQTIGLGMKVSLMAEILVGNNSIPGLGILIKMSYQYAYMDEVFAYSIFAIILIGIIDIILSIAKKKINN